MEELKEFATDRQQEYIDAVLKYGSNRKAAKVLGVHPSTIDRALKSVQNTATRRGWSPDHDMTKPVPEGYMIKGTSTLYDEAGNQRLQWVKTQADREKQLKMMQEAVAACAESIKPEKPVKLKKAVKNLLLNQYTITDYHLGMLSWPEETGEDWNTEIAENLLVAWFEKAISLSPDAETAIFAQIGDFLHWDGLDAVTPTSGHILDADTRFQNLVRVAIRVIRRVIRILLTKHNHVHVIMAEGNHDMASSIWLRELLRVLYEDEPRVTVDSSADPYYCYKHGKTVLFYHHGHKKKVKTVDTVFVAKFKEQYGLAKHAYAHMGHLHHIDMQETNLMVVEQHRTLAAKDAYASRGGWMSGRDAKVITYHKEYGEVGRVALSPDMVKEV